MHAESRAAGCWTGSGWARARSPALGECAVRRTAAFARGLRGRSRRRRGLRTEATFCVATRRRLRRRCRRGLGRCRSWRRFRTEMALGVTTRRRFRCRRRLRCRLGSERRHGEHHGAGNDGGTDNGLADHVLPLRSSNRPGADAMRDARAVQWRGGAGRVIIV